jgi:hypothetical protein
VWTPTGRGPGAVTCDRLGICLAGACAIHCLAGPFVAGVVPLLEPAWTSAGSERALTAISLCGSALTLGRACLRVHRRWRILVPFLAGAGLLSANALAAREGLEGPAASVGGSLLIVAAHMVNIRWCRQRGTRCGSRVAAAADLSYDRA